MLYCSQLEEKEDSSGKSIRLMESSGYSMGIGKTQQDEKIPPPFLVEFFGTRKRWGSDFIELFFGIVLINPHATT